MNGALRHILRFSVACMVKLVVWLFTLITILFMVITWLAVMMTIIVCRNSFPR